MPFHAWLLYNPVAGRYPSRLLAERAARVLRQVGWDVRLESTLSGEHLTHLAQKAAENQVDVLLVSGGDGSINYAISGLLGSETALGVLPAGTSNVWAQELGLPILSWTSWRALEHSAQALAHARRWRMDVGLCNGNPFLLWAGVGLDGMVVNQIEPRSRWERNLGLPQYAATVVRSLTSWHGANIQVLADGKQVSGLYLLAVVSNIRKYVGGMARLSPEACLDDGEMDLWLFEGGSFSDMVRHAIDLLSGRHTHSDQVHGIHFRNLELKADVPLYIQLDGEPFGQADKVSVEVLPQSLWVMVPPQAPGDLFTTTHENTYPREN